MTPFQLILKSLRYYWRTNIIVAIGLSISAAMITGSLIIGDSIKASLYNTAISRLGRVDADMTSPGFFRTKLADDFMHNAVPDLKLESAVPITMMRGSVESMENDIVLPNINVLGFDGSFFNFFPNQAIPFPTGRQALINAALAKELGVKAGDSIIINLDKQQAAPSGTLFAHRAPKDTLQSLRLEVIYILKDTGAGGFKLGAGADIPRNVFVSSDWLASQTEKQGFANTLLISTTLTSDNNNSQILQSILNKSCTLADYGLKTISNPAQNSISLQSESLLLNDQQVKAAQDAASHIGAKTSLTSIYLASEIKNLNTNKSTAYSIIASIQPNPKFNFKSGGYTRPDSNHIWINKWAADDIQAKVGDQLEMSYLSPMPDGAYKTASRKLILSGIVKMSGSAVDNSIVPTFEGMTDTASIEAWNTPFPVDMSRVTKRDDEYWKIYKTVPKAYIGMETAESIWKNSTYGSDSRWITSITISSKTGNDLESLKRQFESELTAHLTPEKSGMVIKPIRFLAIQSAQGTTDFSQLFMAMSFFIVISGLGLAVMLLRLSIERRATEIGMMLTCGFKPSTVMLVISGEGIFLALLGSLLGLPIGAAYSWGIIAALKAWWISAVGTSFIAPHIEMGSLIIGLISGLLAGSISIILSTLSLKKKQTLQLICGWQSISITHNHESGRRSKIILMICIIAILLLIIFSIFTGNSMNQILFFGMGFTLLIASLSVSDLILIRMLNTKIITPSITKLALRSIAANRSRSLLVIGLISCAAFIIITVAASTRDFSNADDTQKNSGAGGFALRAISTMPVHYDLNTPAGRSKLGFSPEDETEFNDVDITSLMMSSGDDISCLNPTKTQYPIILSVNDKLIKREGFGVTTARSISNPWILLDNPDGDSIPIFGDANSVIWNLHSDLGKNYSMPGTNGKPVNMRFAGLIPQSIFAGELLMSEKQFSKTFTNISEPRYFLIDAPAGKTDAIANILRHNLGRSGMEVKTTREILNSYMSVQNTYLSMFLVLGGLGVILGVFGLVVVLLRSAFERRSEFALMITQGFRDYDIIKLLLFENIRLLITGLAFGAISALIAVIPALIGVESRINWTAILILFASFFFVGLASCVVAAKKAANGILVNVLRGE